MSHIFCCSSVKPYRPKQLDHESKFSAFMKWSSSPASTTTTTDSEGVTLPLDQSAYVVQVVRQKNFGALVWKRYFRVAKTLGGDAEFLEITEQDIIDANFEKLNSYKNFKCTIHNLFFEVNLYQKSPLNLHHWRANVARPASNIDLPTKSAGERTAAVHLNVVKPGAGEFEDMSSGQGDTRKQESDPKAQCDLVLEPANKERSELIVEDRHYFDDDYYDRRYEHCSPSRSPSPPAVVRGDDFTACSADECGYCGNCSY